MADPGENRKKVNLSIDLPDDISAIIEHEAIVRAKQPGEILQEIVQKMFDDNSKEISDALKGG
ncbi:hypothetical protein MNBD_NITROSPINAE03-1409 [hydrothermal vent metagenome]|uniref:Uncharacterized protein n=1 Tax=hydrothermal vent metagenome TaxID=652676 RepID=A0A3B1BLL9_9ZZZZ